MKLKLTLLHCRLEQWSAMIAPTLLTKMGDYMSELAVDSLASCIYMTLLGCTVNICMYTIVELLFHVTSNSCKH